MKTEKFWVLEKNYKIKQKFFVKIYRENKRHFVFWKIKNGIGKIKCFVYIAQRNFWCKLIMKTSILGRGKNGIGKIKRFVCGPEKFWSKFIVKCWILKNKKMELVK